MSAIRKSLTTLAAVSVLGTGFALPAVAQAAPSGDSEARSANCNQEYRRLDPGLMAAFAGKNCTKPLGIDRGEEWSWGDRAGQLRSSDNDRASSLINKGTGSNDTVIFYDKTGYDGGRICLKRGEKYADHLGSDDRFHNGKKANNAITSHAWTGSNSKCRGAFMD